MMMNEVDLSVCKGGKYFII